MAEVLLFHHAQGLTKGVLAFADTLRGAGHVVHTPDLYDGHTFASLDEGVGYAQQVGFGTVMERGVQAADDLPAGLVYAGFSLGVMPAQRLAQTRPGAAGALLLEACVPTSEFGSVAGRRPGADPRHGRRPVLRRRGRHRRAACARRRGRRRRAVRLPRRPAPVRRQLARRRTTRPRPRSSPSGCSTSWRGSPVGVIEAL